MNTSERTLMAIGRWRQINIAFPEWATAERTAVAHLAPLVASAESAGLISSWFFIRKKPCWRLRYRPVNDPAHAEAHLLNRLIPLTDERVIDSVASVIYEPETHAFGGPQGMGIAHRLFHQDSRHLLIHFARNQHRPDGGHRRELSVLLCTALLRGADLDWYEQGDVWARVAQHREVPAPVPADRMERLQADLRSLISADTAHIKLVDTPREFVDEWTGVFTTGGRDLSVLAGTGGLHRGLRAILAHHIIFAWNRIGLPAATQATLAHTTRITIFGSDPSTRPRQRPKT